MTKKLCWLMLCMAMCGSAWAQKKVHQFTLGDSTFLLDGKPFQMISGEMHYPRIPREAWRARLKMAKAMGLNTVGTYVFWNVHEPEKGQYDFKGNNDIATFVKMAQEEGLYVVLRPSPYVCAEWEFGGYPYWLQNEKGLIVRSKEPKYLQAYSNYIKAVGKQLAPMLVDHGGNILMVQIENEYGSYGADKAYLEMNRKLFVEAGFNGLLFTCDPPQAIKDGHLPGLLPAVNGVDNPAKVKQYIRAQHDGKGPFYIAEWYPAWFDWWGTKHHTVPAASYASLLDSVLSAGVSINMYMFHGGTTRGFMNGANFNDQNPYEPQTSSYDYDAPLDEAGNPTEKFRQFRNVIAKHLPAGQTLPALPVAKPAIEIPAITLHNVGTIDQLLPAPVASVQPLSFETLHQAYGFVLYRTTLTGGKTGVLKIKDLRDYGVIIVNGKAVGTLDRRHYQDSMNIELPAGKVQLEILVENLGRINFGPYLLKNNKGIVGQVLFDGQVLMGWQQYKLPFTSTTAFTTQQAPASATQPVVKRGSFTLNTVADTYLDLQEWGKGVVWVNGHNLGRYWQVGPQQTVYVPAEWLKQGKNEVMVFELLKPGVNELKGLDHAVLDVLQ